MVRVTFSSYAFVSVALAALVIANAFMRQCKQWGVFWAVFELINLWQRQRNFTSPVCTCPSPT